MKISDSMNVNDQAERMGKEARKSDAATMRGLLVIEFDGMDTQDDPEKDWLRLLCEAVAG